MSSRCRTENLSGRKFGRLTVVSFSGKNDYNRTMWTCQCECGNRVEVISYSLKNGTTKSCGCFREELSRIRNQSHKDSMIGRTFGRLSVESVSEEGSGSTRYNCQCECGNRVEVLGSNLSRGTTKSCGCYNKEIVKETNTTHGLSDHRLYQVWNGMVQRCNNANLAAYSYYGGRGISVCHEWRYSFETFYKWALSNGYSDGLTIDRYPDNNGNYEPGNCRWVTMSEQNRNKRNVKLTVDDVENIRKDNRYQTTIAEDYGVSQATISAIKLNKIWR